MQPTALLKASLLARTRIPFFHLRRKEKRGLSHLRFGGISKLRLRPAGFPCSHHLEGHFEDVTLMDPGNQCKYTQGLQNFWCEDTGAKMEVYVRLGQQSGFARILCAVADFKLRCWCRHVSFCIVSPLAHLPLSEAGENAWYCMRDTLNPCHVGPRGLRARKKPTNFLP